MACVLMNCSLFRSGGRGNHSRWDLHINEQDFPLVLHTIKVHQQFESPASVVHTVRERWAPDIDAMATPFSAICSEYCTYEDNVLATSWNDVTIFVNPAYAPDNLKNTSLRIIQYLTKLIEEDVCQRQCTLIALLPAIHDLWHKKYVLMAHEIHFVCDKLIFNNPFVLSKYNSSSYLWACRSYMICIWRPTERPAQPELHHLDLSPPPFGESLALRCCCLCGKLRVLPRYMPAEQVPFHSFTCVDSMDSRYNKCSAPEFLPILF